MKSSYENPYSIHRLENIGQIEEVNKASTKAVDDVKKVKPIFEWNEKEFQFAKALATLVNDLTQIEFYKIMNITCAKDLWDYFEVTHEVQVK